MCVCLCARIYVYIHTNKYNLFFFPGPLHRVWRSEIDLRLGSKMLLEEYKVRKQVCARRARGDGGMAGGGAGGGKGGGDEHAAVECGAFGGGSPGDGLGAGGGEL